MNKLTRTSQRIAASTTLGFCNSPIEAAKILTSTRVQGATRVKSKRMDTAFGFDPCLHQVAEGAHHFNHAWNGPPVIQGHLMGTYLFDLKEDNITLILEGDRALRRPVGSTHSAVQNPQLKRLFSDALERGSTYITLSKLREEQVLNRNGWVDRDVLSQAQLIASLEHHQDFSCFESWSAEFGPRLIVVRGVPSAYFLGGVQPALCQVAK